MQVAISLLTIVPGVSGGAETYARALTRSLHLTGTHDYEVLLPTIAADAGGGLPSVVGDYAASTTIGGRLRAMAGAKLRPGKLRAQLERSDVVHFPLTVNLPSVRRPTVMTLLDVQHLDLPHLFSRGERLFRRITYDQAAPRADHVIVISEWVRERAIERLGLDPSKVTAIHLGADLEIFTPDPTVTRESFLLYPARPWRHKNHARLLDAFAEVRRIRPELRLVLTGVGHEAQQPEGVDVKGSVSVGELVSLYRRAAALVFPSLYEGFGLPPIEAMACGCPVAASNAGSLPEVCGDAAVQFDPLDVQSIAAGILETLARADELSAGGPRHAATFTWAETARKHDAVYAGV